jgi:hypothetical protein
MDSAFPERQPTYRSSIMKDEASEPTSGGGAE